MVHRRAELKRYRVTGAFLGSTILHLKKKKNFALTYLGQVLQRAA